MSLSQNPEITFESLPFADTLFESSTALADRFSQCSVLALVGVGGSSVGPEALWKILEPLKSKGKQLVVFDNVDFVDTERKFRGLPLKDTVWFVVSKSGSTLETLTTIEWVSQKYKTAKVNFYPQCVVCTEDRPSPLGDWADRHEIPRLSVPVAVGGRFSVLSPVGAFPLSFAGVDLEALRNGAKKALQEKTQIQSFAKEVVQSFEKSPITVFWFYSSVMRPFGGWIQQLWAESLAKKVTLKGAKAPRASTPMFAVGTSDQHSILQQIAEGERDKFVIFFRITELESFKGECGFQEFPELSFLKSKKWGDLIFAASAGTKKALEADGVPTQEIRYPDHSPESLGYLVMWFELLVKEIGSSMGIDPFNQPGVEMSKKLTKEILSTP